MRISPLLSACLSRRTLRLLRLVPALLVGCIPPLTADNVLQEGFEIGEGYLVNAPLAGQGPWTGNSPLTPLASGVAVDPVNHASWGQFSYIGGYVLPVLSTGSANPVEVKQTVRRPLPFVPISDESLVISVELFPHLEGSGPYPDQFHVALRDASGRDLCVVTLANGSILVPRGTLTPLDPGVSYFSDQRRTLVFELSFAEGTWSAWLGAAQVAADRPFLVAGAADLAEFEMRWDRITLFPDTSILNYLLFDNLIACATGALPPTASVSVLPLPADDDIAVTISSQPGTQMVLQYQATLDGDWTNLTNLTADAGGSASHTHIDALLAGRGFYRVMFP